MGRPTDEERFWPKVAKTATCWLWQGALFRSGYGAFRYSGQMRVAHRFAYERHIGAVPEGLQLDHLCRVRHCVNPAHLEPVTQRENGLRGVSFAAVNAKKTHCVNGHEYTAENTETTPPKEGNPEGGRRCRTCHRASTKASKARKAACS